MKILLDTQILLWSLNGEVKLPSSYAFALNSTENDLYISAASLWEIAIKVSDRKLTIPGGDVETFFRLTQALGAQLVPVLPAHLALLSGLPKHHHDPFDRVIVCQAKFEGMVLASVDRMIKRYDVKLLT